MPVSILRYHNDICPGGVAYGWERDKSTNRKFGHDEMDTGSAYEGLVFGGFGTH